MFTYQPVFSLVITVTLCCCCFFPRLNVFPFWSAVSTSPSYLFVSFSYITVKAKAIFFVFCMRKLYPLPELLTSHLSGAYWPPWFEHAAALSIKLLPNPCTIQLHICKTNCFHFIVLWKYNMMQTNGLREVKRCTESEWERAREREIFVK